MAGPDNGDFHGSANGFEVTAHIWVLELAGKLDLPSTATAVILREHVPQGLNPTILLLDVIPLGVEGTTDVITPHPVGFVKLGFGRLEIETIELLYGGKTLASVPVRRLGR